MDLILPVNTKVKIKDMYKTGKAKKGIIESTTILNGHVMYIVNIGLEQGFYDPDKTMFISHIVASRQSFDVIV
jgi:hypothetical protein